MADISYDKPSSLEELTTLVVKIKNLINKNVGWNNRTVKDQLQFLLDSMDNNLILLNAVVPEFRLHPYYMKVKERVIMFLELVYGILLPFDGRNIYLNDNFDMLEFKLNEHYQELAHIFPGGRLVKDPINYIQDEEASALWKATFGEDKFFVTFDEFMGMLEKRGSINIKRFRPIMKYFLDFPSGGFVTTYRWNMLLKTFAHIGAFEDMVLTIASSKGFLGLTNRAKAVEILSLTPPGHRYFFIRFSRTQPGNLVYSYVNDKREYGHVINSTGNPTILFINSKFVGYEILEQRLHFDKILGDGSDVKSFVEYVNAPSEKYYV